jgi:hypothetical protein
MPFEAMAQLPSMRAGLRTKAAEAVFPLPARYHSRANQPLPAKASSGAPSTRAGQKGRTAYARA